VVKAGEGVHVCHPSYIGNIDRIISRQPGEKFKTLFENSSMVERLREALSSNTSI
jgi:hypothetical protein